MLFRTQLNTMFIETDELSFPMNGFISPSFYNDGETSVLINHQEVLPGESFSIEVPGGVFEGKCRIQFKSEVGKVDRLVLNAAIYIGKYIINDETGQAYNVTGESC